MLPKQDLIKIEELRGLCPQEQTHPTLRGAFQFWGVMPFHPESLKFKGESVI
jgi:hypothetical protein